MIAAIRLLCVQADLGKPDRIMLGFLSASNVRDTKPSILSYLFENDLGKNFGLILTINIELADCVAH
jgi:hypothetical protein